MAVTGPILCTQPAGCPEVSDWQMRPLPCFKRLCQIAKKSTSESDVAGGRELFIIGKNFVKDSKVVWQGMNDWVKVVEPNREFLHSVSDSDSSRH